MSELTLASRPASTAGIEGITSRYDADRAAAEREERVAAFDGIVDALLREKQESVMPARVTCLAKAALPKARGICHNKQNLIRTI